MKMAPGLFWGILLILLGLAIILRVLFDIHIFGVFFALFIIFIGISMLVGRNWMFRPHQTTGNDVIFDDRTFSETPHDGTEYNVIFGKSTYDFRNAVPANDNPLRIKINTIFGSTTVRISKDKAVRIKSDAVFGSSVMPDGNTVAFGSIGYATDSVSVGNNYLFIEAPVIFGSLRFVEE